MKTNDENCYIPFLKREFSNVQEGATSKNCYGASPQTSIFHQATYEKRLLWHILLSFWHRCVTCKRPPVLTLISTSVPPPQSSSAVHGLVAIQVGFHAVRLRNVNGTLKYNRYRTLCKDSIVCSTSEANSCMYCSRYRGQ